MSTVKESVSTKFHEFMETRNFINLGIVVNGNGEVLMIKRKKPEMGKDGKVLLWAFPGGRQKFDMETNQAKETREECVRREVLVETGYDVVSAKLIGLKSHPDIPNVVVVYHRCNLTNSQPIAEPQEPDEVELVRWVKIQDIRSLITTTLDDKVAKELGI